MCASCGCSSDGGVKITHMGTGKHFHLQSPEPMADGRAVPEHNHSHGHDYPHDHEPSHGQEHEHNHDTRHEHEDEHEHEHEHEQQIGMVAHAALLSQRASAPAPSRSIRLEHDLLARNNQLAERNRGWFSGRQIFALNWMSAPGAGKTSLLERMIRDLANEFQFYVIEGDQATTRDAQRIRATGCNVVQINTGAGCHLDAAMVQAAVRSLDPSTGGVLAIENVGNLVCPSLFDLGEAARVVVVSVTEGDDKPAKYPYMFRSADVILLNKVDLLPYVDFGLESFNRLVKQINPSAPLYQVSSTRGDGLSAWYEWLRNRRCRMLHEL